MSRQGSSIADELTRRASKTDLLEKLFLARPRSWIGVSELAGVAGFCGWRSRVADVRKRLLRAGAGDVQWNGKPQTSAYRFNPIAEQVRTREARRPARQASLFPSSMTLDEEPV